mgnify:CR=1 FL=1
MNVEIYHLPYAGYEDEENRKPAPAREMRMKVEMDDHEPSQAEFDDLWEKAGEEEIEADSPEDAIRMAWERWNAGSGRESVAFARRECKDCDAVFTGEREDGRVDLSLRQKNAEKHHKETMVEVGGPHEVEPSTRSLSTGDIVVVDGSAYLCEMIGWSELEGVDA